MQNEGIIKFQCENQAIDAVSHEMIADINLIRTLLFDLNLIGVDFSENINGIGFGNISKKLKNNQLSDKKNQFYDGSFIISGSGTGNSRVLSAKNFSIVEKCNIEANSIYSKGLCNASSESLSHFAVYSSLKNINFVIHIHNRNLWNFCKNKIPTTNQNAEYGTPEMAYSIINCIKNSFNCKKRNENFEKNNSNQKNSYCWKNIETQQPQAIVMGGHIDGMLFFGENLTAIFHLILGFLKFLK